MLTHEDYCQEPECGHGTPISRVCNTCRFEDSLDETEPGEED